MGKTIARGEIVWLINFTQRHGGAERTKQIKLFRMSDYFNFIVLSAPPRLCAKLRIFQSFNRFSLHRIGRHFHELDAIAFGIARPRLTVAVFAGYDL